MVVNIKIRAQTDLILVEVQQNGGLARARIVSGMYQGAASQPLLCVGGAGSRDLYQASFPGHTQLHADWKWPENEVITLRNEDFRNIANAARIWNRQFRNKNTLVLTFDPLVCALALEYDVVCYLVRVLALSMLKDTQFAEVAIKHSSLA